MLSPFSRGIIGTTLVAFVVFSAVLPRAWAQADAQGQWSTLSYTMPINPIHMALLRNGKILVVAGSGNCPPTRPGAPRVRLTVHPIVREPWCWIPAPAP